MSALKSIGRMVQFFMAYGAFGRAVKGLHGARGLPAIESAAAALEARAARLEQLGRPDPSAPPASAVVHATLVARFMARSARGFASGDFEGAFQGAQELWETGDASQSAMGLNMALDALGQIKLRALRTGSLADYSARLGASESELMAAANRAMSRPSAFASKPGDEPRLIASRDFEAGLSMGAAHLKWVSGDLPEARRWTQQAIARYGADEIACREIQPREGMHWFYDHVDQDNLARFRAFVGSELPAPKRSPSP